jgi:hypothetical protein
MRRCRPSRACRPTDYRLCCDHAGRRNRPERLPTCPPTRRPHSRRHPAGLAPAPQRPSCAPSEVCPEGPEVASRAVRGSPAEQCKTPSRAVQDPLPSSARPPPEQCKTPSRAVQDPLPSSARPPPTGAGPHLTGSRRPLHRKGPPTRPITSKTPPARRTRPRNTFVRRISTPCSGRWGGTRRAGKAAGATSAAPRLLPARLAPARCSSRPATCGHQ